MPDPGIQARHVFHIPTTGWDRLHAWQEGTAEPVFIWGSGSGLGESRFFGDLKKTFGKWIEGTGGANALTVYHDGVGADALGSLDPAPHKVIALHSFYSRWQRHFEWQLRSTGRVLLGNLDQVVELKRCFPWIPERFLHHVPEPLLSDHETQPRAEGSGPKVRLGIWLHGANWKRHGNRLRSIVDRWSPGDGELEMVLAKGQPPSWAKKDGVRWSTDLPFAFAVMRLFTWDSTLLLNDFHLDAPWLMRALSLGCFPLVPDGENVALHPHWEAEAAPQRYPWGNITGALELLREWREAREQLQPAFTAWAQELLAKRSPSTRFSEIWVPAREALVNQRPPKLGKRRAPSSFTPIAWYERLLRLRLGG